MAIVEVADILPRITLIVYALRLGESGGIAMSSHLTSRDLNEIV